MLSIRMRPDSGFTFGFESVCEDVRALGRLTGCEQRES